MAAFYSREHAKMLRLSRPVLCAAALLMLAASPSAHVAAAAPARANPFASPSPLPLQAPPFDQIKDSDYAPGFDQAIKENLAEIDKIANSAAPPTFDNTIVAMERAGQM